MSKRQKFYVLLCAIVLIPTFILGLWLNTHSVIKASVKDIENGIVTFKALNGWEFEYETNDEFTMFDDVTLIIRNNNQNDRSDDEIQKIIK